MVRTRPDVRIAARLERLSLLIILVVLSLTPRTAAAQTMRPMQISEEVVVTGTVEPVSFEQLARTVYVLLGGDLDRLGVDGLAEALRLVAGVDVRARGPLDVQSDFAVRGATFGQSLVLYDGWRLNDSQSGHHNGDIPLPAVGIDRIEILTGPASAVHGADAMGGTINVISRRGAHAALSASAGQHGLAAAQVSSSGRVVPTEWTLTGWGSRSSGFMFDRDFAIGGAGVRGAPAPGLVVDARHQRKAFGANGFYGNSPSKEWTDQTLASLSWQRTAGAWSTTARGLFRNHGDHFRWDIARPGFAENRHRTNAGEVQLMSSRGLAGGRRVTIGATAGGDAIASSNLGDHTYGHGSGFVELQAPLSGRASVQAGLRVDGYSAFGTAWSPSISSGVWLTPSVRVRASAARAFRIPTYTERYYSDPAHLASDDLRPERGWSVDGGLDWMKNGWLLSVSAFRRWDEDVIDWVKAVPEDRWNTTNVRDVATTGIEATVSRSWSGAVVRLTAATLDVDAPTLNLLSKYVLEYARHSMGASVATPLGGGFRAATTIDHRRRFDADAYTLVGLRLSRDLGRAAIFADVSNLFDADYVEVPGVAMPGRWLTVGATIR